MTMKKPQLGLKLRFITALAVWILAATTFYHVFDAGVLLAGGTGFVVGLVWFLLVSL